LESRGRVVGEKSPYHSKPGGSARARRGECAGAWVNRNLSKRDLASRLTKLDHDLGILEQKAVRKTLYDAGQLACYIQDM